MFFTKIIRFAVQHLTLLQILYFLMRWQPRRRKNAPWDTLLCLDNWNPTKPHCVRFVTGSFTRQQLFVIVEVFWPAIEQLSSSAVVTPDWMFYLYLYFLVCFCWYLCFCLYLCFLFASVFVFLYMCFDQLTANYLHLRFKLVTNLNSDRGQLVLIWCPSKVDNFIPLNMSLTCTPEFTQNHVEIMSTWKI